MGACWPTGPRETWPQAAVWSRTSKIADRRLPAPGPEGLFSMRIYILIVATALWAGPVFAQAAVAPAPILPAAPVAPSGTLSLCNGAYQIGPPANLPPAGSGPVVYNVVLCFPKQGNISLVEPQTYLYYMQSPDLVSLPSRNEWKAYNGQAEETIVGDHKRLWATNFLDDLSIETADYAFSNGVAGKVIVYNMEERQRIKNTVYNEGTKEIEQAKVEERLRELGITIRLDSFVDQATEKRVANVIREMLVEKGFQEAKVEPVHEALPGGPKTVALKFKVTEGPKVKISSVDFAGNDVFGDGTLKRRMKNNKGGGFWIFPGSGVYQEDKFEEDAEGIIAFYREKGYLQSDVGQPNLKHLRDSTDGKTRYMTLEIPITEGTRYRVDKFEFAGNDKVPADALRPLFKLKTGDFYNEKRIRDGFEKAKEIYGSGGYFEMTPLPEFAFDSDKVNVTMRINEGKQYFINRITFLGNTTTRDNVIRREMRLYENSVFNTEALKFSVRRLNQLGYFKPLEDQKNIQIDKTPNVENKVDVTLKFEEQNRNQLSFGAGVSQYDGVFGQLSFSTANFMGRGETFTISLQSGARASDYQIAFTEPFLFDRPITGSVDLHKRKIQYIDQFTQGSTGGNLTFGFPQSNFSRMYLDYSYDKVHVSDLNQAFFDQSCYGTNEGCRPIDFKDLTEQQRLLIESSPYLRDALLIGQGGRRVIGKITPTFSLNSVDNPVTPVTGRRYTASFAVAGIGGDTRYLNPTVEGIWFLQQSRRITLGLRAQAEYIRSFGTSSPLPIFERLVLGGGYSVRGYDLRTIGPQDPASGIVIGGNKSMLFNAEYLISVGGPVRLILFYDAGQVKDTGQRFVGRDFITSTGMEVRFFMPVLNVPFRLIFASNPQRKGVLNYSTGQPEKAFRFRFDVGSTF
ncbi:MAG: outer membrane protein assembly factor BamA [Acidobacteria bacterium]|nr:outer membrane protein assembly factor BamA [Acidobacteriota bacterium]